MSSIEEAANHRILVVDANEHVHKEFREILCPVPPADGETETLESKLFDVFQNQEPQADTFEMDSAFSGQEGLEYVRRALREGKPYAVAFVDTRLPTGRNGLETINNLWKEDPTLQVVICTAFSDRSLEEMLRRLRMPDQWLILKRPFHGVEAFQLASSLCEKWRLQRTTHRRVNGLEEAVRERTRDLEEQQAYLSTTVAKLQEAYAQILYMDRMVSMGRICAGVADQLSDPLGLISSNLNSLSHYSCDLRLVLAQFHQLSGTSRSQAAETSGRTDNSNEPPREIDVDFLAKDVAELVEECIEAIQRVQEIVNDLRELAHIDQPDLSINDINLLIDKAVDVASKEIKRKAVVIREYGDLPPIACYGGLLRQMFSNLLVNAAQAIQQEGVITVRTGLEGPTVWIEVEDNGCGIASADIDHIFEPFFTTRNIESGSGMGLCEARRIAEEHGGQISIKTTSAKGTVLRVVLPACGPPQKQEYNRKSDAVEAAWNSEAAAVTVDGQM